MPLVARRILTDPARPGYICTEELRCDDDGFYLTCRGSLEKDKHAFNAFIRLKDEQVDGVMKKFGV